MPNGRFQNRVFTHLTTASLSFSVWALLYFTLPWLNGNQAADTIFRLSIGSGYVALILLCLTLILGVWRLIRRNRKMPIHFDLRRDVGIWAGFFAILHASVGLLVHFRGKGFRSYFLYPSEQVAAFPVRYDMFGFANHTGLIALIIVALLATISNDFSLKKLGGRRWKGIQRLNYLFFALVLIHAALYMVIENRSLFFVSLALLLFGSTIVLQIGGFVKYRRIKFAETQLYQTGKGNFDS